MKKTSVPKLLTITMTLLSTLFISTTAFAAETAGKLTAVDDSHIAGWAWNVGSYDETVNIELHIYKDGSADAAKVIIVSADGYSKESKEAVDDGYHGFDSKIDWSALGGTSYKVEAYAISGEEKILLPESIEYKPADSGKTETDVEKANSDTKKAESTDGEGGPGTKAVKESVKEETPATESSTGSYKKGSSLGNFTTTGYCNCRKCCGGGRTYSGTIPQANHTISADISVLPIGTKVMIGSTVYTVEDIGGGVNGHKIDIFYGSHSEALAHGMKTQEVFSVIKE